MNENYIETLKRIARISLILRYDAICCDKHRNDLLNEQEKLFKLFEDDSFEKIKTA